MRCSPSIGTAIRADTNHTEFIIVVGASLGTRGDFLPENRDCARTGGERTERGAGNGDESDRSFNPGRRKTLLGRRATTTTTTTTTARDRRFEIRQTVTERLYCCSRSRVSSMRPANDPARPLAATIGPPTSTQPRPKARLDPRLMPDFFTIAQTNLSTRAILDGANGTGYSALSTNLDGEGAWHL